MHGTGIGPALRKARLLQGKSIEEASRETRIRAEYLRALERERFEMLLGDVYARGFLRSYSTYLGLDPDKVLSVFSGHFGGPQARLPAPAPGPSRSPKGPHPHLPDAMRNHPSWTFVIILALGAAGLLAATGLFRSDAPSASEPAPGSVASTPVTAREVTLAIHATRTIRITVTADGVVVFSDLFRRDEQRSFEAASTLQVQLERGASAELTVNGHSLGVPGEPDSPYGQAFGPADFREP